MADRSTIEWTEAPLKVRKAAAARLGVPLAEYDRRRASGEKWCTGCKQWHRRTSFTIDRSRGDGVAKWCRTYASSHGRNRYQPKSRPIPGRRYVPARPGDRAQARRRINHLVDIGQLPHPNTVPCADCGHVFMHGVRRHEYDHYLGYDANNHEDVEPVCTRCHHAREAQRRAD